MEGRLRRGVRRPSPEEGPGRREHPRPLRPRPPPPPGEVDHGAVRCAADVWDVTGDERHATEAVTGPLPPDGTPVLCACRDPRRRARRARALREQHPEIIRRTGHADEDDPPYARVTASQRFVDPEGRREWMLLHVAPDEKSASTPAPPATSSCRPATCCTTRAPSVSRGTGDRATPHPKRVPQSSEDSGWATGDETGCGRPTRSGGPAGAMPAAPRRVAAAAATAAK